MSALIAAMVVTISIVFSVLPVLAKRATAIVTADYELLPSSSALTIATAGTSGTIWLGFQQGIGES